MDNCDGGVDVVLQLGGAAVRNPIETQDLAVRPLNVHGGPEGSRPDSKLVEQQHPAGTTATLDVEGELLAF